MVQFSRRRVRFYLELDAYIDLTKSDLAGIIQSELHSKAWFMNRRARIIQVHRDRRLRQAAKMLKHLAEGLGGDPIDLQEAHDAFELIEKLEA